MSNLAKYLMAAAGNTSSAGGSADYREASEYTHIAFDTVVGFGDSGSDVLGVFIKPDGTKFYHMDTAEQVEEYNLSTAFDITSHGNRINRVNLRTLSSNQNAAGTSISCECLVHTSRGTRGSCASRCNMQRAARSRSS